MRDEDVPQEGNSTLAGQRKAMYARGADGRLHIVQSAGWEVEEIVTRQAVEDLQQQAEAARQGVLQGLTAPLEYHMYRQRMDVPMLSQVTGLWQWRIRRHLRPEIFARLSPALRARYAEALGMSCAQLDQIE